MTKVNEIENEKLRELMTFPYAGLSEYSADLGVQRRVGKLLTDAYLRLPSSKSREICEQSAIWPTIRGTF